MVTRVDAVDAKQLIDDGITVFDALPESIWQQEHLPTARSLPLESFRPDAVADLDRDEPLLVYCFDQHCDLSARMASRLDELGFTHVHDLIGGRAAWTALGFPTEGSVGDRRRIAHYARSVPTVGLDATVDDVRRLGEQQYPTPVVTADGVLMGAVHPTATALPSDTKVAEIMVPAPGTIRPEQRIDEVAEQLHKDGLDHVFVTAVNGTLIGLISTAELHV